MAERSRPPAAAGVLVAVLLGLLTGCGGDSQGGGVVSGVVAGDNDGMNGAVLTTPYRLADARLTDTSGDRVDLHRALGKPLTLVFFGYTNCPDICQAVMADLASANARLDAAEARRVSTWFITTDPARDDPAALRAYLDRFNPRFQGFTGPLPAIVDVAGSVHVPIEKGTRLPSGGYEVVHGTAVLGVRPDGSVPIVWTAGTSAAKIAADIHTILTSGLSTGLSSGTSDEG